MRESELLAHIYQRSTSLGEHVVVGPGDDCAVVRLTDNGPAALLTTDQLVEGRHYNADTPLDLVARKAIARSISDIAAMGGSPVCALAAATINSEFTQANELFDAMARWALRWSCPLVGGDIAIADGPTVLTTTVIGTPHRDRGAVLRSQARSGDLVCVTGSLGNSLATGRHLSFEPRLLEGAALCDAFGNKLGAMIDLSDGLGRDAGRIAAASGVRLTLESSLLPRAEGADWRSALQDGEDYELCFTLRGEAPAELAGTPVTVVGVVDAGSGCRVRTPDGEFIDGAAMGWDHES